MNEARRRWPLGLLVTLLLSGCGGPSFKKYTITEGGYLVELPGPPKDKTEVPSGKVTVKAFDDRQGTYAVAHLDVVVPADEKPEVIKKRLIGAQDGAVNKLGGKLIRDEGIALNLSGKLIRGEAIDLKGKYPGRDFLAELPDKRLLHERLYLVDGRLFQVLVLGEKAWVESREADQFLDSFALLK